MHENDPLITITEISQQLPGHPSIHAIWRWCRKGVRTRSGQRVYLQHQRMGRKIYTRATWVDEFGRQVAASDAAHFHERQNATAPGRSSAGKGHERTRRQEHLERIHRELDVAGL